MKPVLVKPNLDRELRIKTDTLDYMMGEVLLMWYKNNKWRSIAFISK